MDLTYHYMGTLQSIWEPTEPFYMEARFNKNRGVIWGAKSCDLIFTTIDCVGTETTTRFALSGNPDQLFAYYAGPTAQLAFDCCKIGARPKNSRFWGVVSGRTINVRGSTTISSLALIKLEDGTYCSDFLDPAEETTLRRRWDAFLHELDDSPLGQVTGTSRTVR